jgi:hypothetical protein
MNETKEIMQYREDVFSEIVKNNAGKAVRSQKRAKYKRKAIGRVRKRAAILGLSAWLIFGLGQFGLVDWRLSATLTAICGLASMFNAGILYGVIRGIKL